MGGAYGPSLRSLTGIGGLGDDTTDPSVFTDVLQAITAGSTAAAQIINATNTPACPIGQVRNAAGVCALVIPGAAVGTITTPAGAATLGVSGTTIAMLALAGLVVLVLVMKK